MEGVSMGPVILEKSEMLALLDLLGVQEVIGLEERHLHAPEAFERPLIIDDGRNRLLEQHRLSVADDHYEIESDLEAMMVIITNPNSVVRVSRTIPDSDEAYWCWYYASEGEIIQLVASGPEEFELDRVGDIDGILAELVEFLPLEPAPDALHYRAIVDQEDADLVRALLDDWDEVPALSVMEADGLQPAEAVELYDDLEEPQWRGQVDFMACESGQIRLYRRLLVLQGDELSWLAWQDVADKSDLHIQTAETGALQEHLKTYLTEVLA
jgi:hypothetical protein